MLAARGSQKRASAPETPVLIYACREVGSQLLKSSVDSITLLGEATKGERSPAPRSVIAMLVIAGPAHLVTIHVWLGNWGRPFEQPPQSAAIKTGQVSRDLTILAAVVSHLEVVPRLAADMDPTWMRCH